MKKEVKSLVKNKKTYNKKTPEEKKQEIKELSDKVFSRIERYTTSPEDLIEYADYLAMFHSYSANNMALIYEQFGNSRAVASFKDWKDKGYNVNKGEKGIKILSYTPVTYFKDSKNETKQISEATAEEKNKIKLGKLDSWKVNAFKIGHVFDVTQTNCPIEDLPKVFPNRQFNFEIEDGNNIDHLRKGIEKVAENLNININDMRESELGLYELGHSKGAYVEDITGTRKEIVMNSRNTETQAIATSIHELAHAKLHNSNKEGAKFDSATQEFQAELTSYIVCKHFGMDTSEKAIPYIAGWTSNGDKIEDKSRAFEEVHNTSKEFIDIMDQVISQEREKETSELYPKDIEDVQYCDLTGEPLSNLEPYYYVGGGTILSEKSHSLLYTEKEWQQIYDTDSDDNYWTEEIYDLPDSELTDIKPENLYNDVYYKYNPNDQTKPEKLGTISDIVSKAHETGEFDRSFISDLYENRWLDKDDFNGNMADYNVLKNAKLPDFQRINEKNGLEKNKNLDDLVKDQLDLKRKIAMQRSMQR